MNIDGVYLHGHEGYLLEQMSNPAFNRRKLGVFRDYRAFGVAMVREIRKRTGDGYPIMYRIDLSLALTETYGARMASVTSLRAFSHERTVDETLTYMDDLVAAGVDIFDVDLGSYDNWWLPHPPGPMEPGVYLDMPGSSRNISRHLPSVRTRVSKCRSLRSESSATRTLPSWPCGMDPATW